MSSCISVEIARQTKHDFLKQRETNVAADQSHGPSTLTEVNDPSKSVPCNIPGAIAPTHESTTLAATRSSDRRLRSKTKQPETPNTDTKKTVQPRKPPSAPSLQPECEGDQDDEPFECTSMDSDVLAVKTHMPGKLKMLSEKALHE